MFSLFFKWMVTLTGLAWMVLAVPLYNWGQPAVTWGTIIGCLLSAICFIAGFYSLCRSFHLPMQKFMVVFMSGMLARLFFIGIAFFLMLWLTPLHVASFLVSLLGFYVLYLVLELYFVNNRLHNVKEGP